jgi:two-component system response regulator AtoC
MPHALIVDDDAQARDSLAELVTAAGFSVARAENLSQAREQIALRQPDAVLIDLQLPDGSGIELIADIRSRASSEIVLITGQASVETAIAALRAGAADYLIKPVDHARLAAVLARVPRTADLRSQISSLRGELIEFGRYGRLLGKSAAMRRVYEQISRVAPTEATVLLEGESGTGKELAAQTLHDLSRRRSGPFVVVDCGAISPQSIEAVLFGLERGGGGHDHEPGYFEHAEGGSLLLDNITEMPLLLQIKLLRVIENRRYTRLGSSREIDSDLRLFAASSRRAEDAVAEGQLRAELYHRLNVFPIRMPPLAARDGDVELLALHFLQEFNASQDGHKHFAASSMPHLLAQRWPGNVRELRNCILRAHIMADDEILPRHLLGQSSADSVTGSDSIDIRIGVPLAEADRQLILATLERCGGVKKLAAETLGISLKTLYNRLDEYGLGAAASRPERARAAARKRGDAADEQ